MASDDYLHLPITPSSPSLASHLAALDILAARLATLTTRTTWPTRVPVNSKASFEGEIVDNNNLKINVAGEWWIEMTAQEAQEWVRRRKATLLEEHARALEGWRPGMPIREADTSQTSAEASSSRTSEVPFDSVFRTPVGYSASPVASSSTAKPASVSSVEEVSAKSSSSQSPPPQAAEVRPPPVHKAKREYPKPGQSISRTVIDHSSPRNPAPVAIAGPSNISASAPQKDKDTIAKVLGDFMEQQEALGKASGRAGSKGGDLADGLMTEDGLPIHEIREDATGALISQAPEPTASEDDIPEQVEVEEDDYWSPAAVARREALRRSVFEDSDADSDTSLDSENDDSRQSVSQTGQTSRIDTSSPWTPGPSQPTITQEPPTPISPPSTTEPSDATSSSPAPAPALRRPSSSNSLTPKSILKPAPRKKSVSFDDSIPLPPDSPDMDQAQPQPTMLGRSGFPSPIVKVDVQEEFTPRPIPVLAAPTPAKHKAAAGQTGTGSGDGFAGFKKGFLTAAGKGKIAPPSPVSLTSPMGMAQSSHSSSANTAAAHMTPAAIAPPPQPVKKQSLFAQRIAESGPSSTDDDQVIRTASPVSLPTLPKMSEAKATSSVKSAVVEKPSTTASGSSSTTSARPEAKSKKDGSTAGVANAVVERRAAPIAPSSSRSPIVDGPDASTRAATDEEEEDGDEEDLYEMDVDGDEDEDEYDLDDALLAREVALEYHRRQASSAFGSRSTARRRGTRNPDKAEEEDEGDMSEGEYRRRFPASDDEGEGEGEGEVDGEEGEEGGAGVMMALPSIATLGSDGLPRIVNPTPDDLRQFVRVGKLENGNFVLAPGERGWSDDEAEEEEEDDDHDGGQGVLDRLEGEGADGKKLSNREEMKRLLMAREVPPPGVSSSPIPTPASTSARRHTSDLQTTKQATPGVRAKAMERTSIPNQPRDASRDIQRTISDKVQMPIELPPSVKPAVVASVQSGLGERHPNSEGGQDIPNDAPAPRKVSRFKAARMGGE